MIKMNRKTKNNLNFSKDLSLNIKFSSKNHESIFKPNDKSLDIVSSPIKNNKKVIKRNTRTNSYNSFLCNQTENTNKNPFNSNIISVDSNNKINQKKNIYTFLNGEWTLGQNSKTKNNNNNLKKNKKIKQNGKSRTKTKNITAHQSTSNLAKYNINISTDNNINNFISDNISHEYINVNTNPNQVPQFILNKKKNAKINNHSHFQHSNLLNSNEFNFINNKNKDKEKDKYHFRNNNYTSKNLLFLTRPNINSKKFLEKNKISICKNAKHQHQQALNEQFFNSNIKGENSYQKSKKIFKNINVNTTKNSEDKKDYKLNMNRINNNISNKLTNLLELSTDEQNKKFLNEFELLYNCLKKRNDTFNKGQRNKSGNKKNNLKFKKNKYNLLEDEDSLLGIIYENKQIKQKNEELSQQVENIKKEIEQMKKDNIDIKEELKEKNKSLKDIKLSMDIFSQELLKLQNLCKEKENDKTTNNYNISLNLKENDINLEQQKSIIDTNYKNTKNNELKINNININKINPKNINLKNIIDNTNNHIYKNDKDKDSINNYETDINNIINNNNNLCPPKKNKLEKIHQLSLNNINNIINQQNKKRGGSLEANTFQDTSKIINIETKDTTEKENECLNDKWPSPLYIEKEKKKENNDKENSKEIDDTNSIDLSNISLADNLNINQEVYNNALNMKKSNVGKLDFKNKLDKKGNEDNKIKKTPKKINLINQGIVNDNFNEEFLKYYDKFSDSWRKEVDKMLKKGKEKE